MSLERVDPRKPKFFIWPRKVGARGTWTTQGTIDKSTDTVEGDHYVVSRLSGGGGFHGRKKKHYCITAKIFRNPHTEFGARRSRRLGVMSATN